MIWNPHTKEEIAAMERGLLTDEQRRAVEARLSSGPARADRCDNAPPALPGGRHPWLAVFESNPRAAYENLLSGSADIGAERRLNADQQAVLIFGGLDVDDPAMQALSHVILGWLHHQSQKVPSTGYVRQQRWVRKICDTFRIIMLLKPRLAASELLFYRDRWLTWTATLAAEPARDAASVLRDTIAVLERDRCDNIPAGADTPDALQPGSVMWQPGALQWQPIKTAPHGTWVLVCGKSDYVSRPAFITVAIHDADYRPLSPWRDLDLIALSDSGWTPLFWCPLPALPAMP